MQQRLALFLGMCAVLGAGNASAVVQAPSVGVWMDGTWTAIPVNTFDTQVQLDDGSPVLDAVGFEIAGPQSFGDETNGFEVQSLAGTWIDDPYLSYGVAVVDFGAPSDFRFTFSAPIVPVAGPNHVSSTFSGSLTGAGGSDVTFTPLTPPMGVPTDGDSVDPEAHVVTLSEDGGSTLVSMGHDLGGDVVTGTGSLLLPAYNEGIPFGTLAGPTSTTGWDYLGMDLSFSLSGFGDIATLNGDARIEQVVPLPPAALLLGVGLFGYLAIARARPRQTEAKDEGAPQPA
jgi:hypothetical protein